MASGRLRRRVPEGPAEPAAPMAPGVGTALPLPPPGQRPAAISRAQAARECRFDKKLALFGLSMHGATQVVSLLAWSSLPVSERFQRLLSIAHGAAACLVPALAPVFYMRWRPHLLLTYRVTFFAFPLLRRARGAQAVGQGPGRRRCCCCCCRCCARDSKRVSARLPRPAGITSPSHPSPSMASAWHASPPPLCRHPESDGWRGAARGQGGAERPAQAHLG
jgi:hypothetical protein